MTTMKLFGTTAAVMMGLMTASAVQAQSFRHIDQLASQLERQVREVHEEVHAHFRLTSRYVHLDQDVAAMERLADHIHDLVHRGSSVSHMRSDVAELDRLYHHVEELVEFLARNEIEWAPPSVEDTVAMIEGVAAGKVTEPELADWLRTSHAAS